MAGNLLPQGWTAEDDRVLIEAYEREQPLNRTARQLDRSTAAVKQRAAKLRKGGVRLPRLERGAND